MHPQTHAFNITLTKQREEVYGPIQSGAVLKNMDSETVEVVSSDNTMDTSIAEAPSAEPTPETPASVEEAPKEELYELPDGRKVDAQTLSREWKENFYPDYTRKSQALAAKEKTSDITNKPTKEVDPFENPDYVPQSYAELVKIAEERAIKAIDQRQQEAVERQQAIENEVEAQLSTIRTQDPNLNENALFLHANKYGFRDLSVAYQNMKDMNLLAKTVQQTTAKNIAKRADPVSTTQGQANGSRPDPSAFSSARDYLRSLKN